MELILDPDVQAVAEFMQGGIPTARLVAVAKALSSLAPILWGRYEPEPVQALRLANFTLGAISHSDQHIQQASI